MLGFIGLGTMGAPICRNLAAKSGQEVRAFDADLEVLAQMDEPGVSPAESIRDVAEHADIVFLSLPGGPEVSAVCLGAGSLLTHLKPGGLVVDLSTTPLSVARDLGARFSARGIQFADAPVARTRQAAVDGTLSVMVGANEKVFARIKPLLECFATDITLCGGPGAGQAMKIVNNMVLFQNVVAIAEALALIGHAGIDPELAFDVLSKGSADSFALRHHGMKAMLQGRLPRARLLLGVRAQGHPLRAAPRRGGGPVPRRRRQREGNHQEGDPRRLRQGVLPGACQGGGRRNPRQEQRQEEERLSAAGAARFSVASAMASFTASAASTTAPPPSAAGPGCSP